MRTRKRCNSNLISDGVAACSAQLVLARTKRDKAAKLGSRALQKHRCRRRRRIFVNDRVGTLGAAIADVDARARYELPDLLLGPLAESAAQKMTLHLEPPLFLHAV